MSVFNRLAPLIPQVSASCRQTKEHPKVCLAPPLSLSSPVIKKKAIQIPSFDEKGLIFEKHSTNPSAPDRSLDSVCSSRTSSQSSWRDSCQRNHGERASTLPRTKPQTQTSQSLSPKPRISIFPAPKPNSSPTLPTLKTKPSDSLHPPASHLSDPSPSLHQPEPKLRVSPTLIVPTPRRSPSPTSLCQGTSSDGRGGKQPSPVAKERRARSIPISNAKAESSTEAKRDILDQEALRDFTHTDVRPRHQTHSESYRLPATSQSPCLLQSKPGISNKDKPKTPPRNTDITAIPKPKPDIKQKQEVQQSEATGTQTSVSESEGIKSDDVLRESQSLFDGPAAHSSLNLQSKCTDVPQRSTQTSDFTSRHRAYERMYSQRRAAFSTEPVLSQSTVSPNTETRRRRVDLHSETSVETTCLSGPRPRKPPEENNIQRIAGNLSKIFQQTGASQNIRSPQKHRSSLKAQSQTPLTNVRSAVSQSDCVSKDYSRLSRDMDPKMEASQCAHRLNRLKTCLVAPQTQEASHPASGECTTSQRGLLSKPDLRSRTLRFDQQRPPGQSKSHKEVNVTDSGLNQTDIFAPPDHHGVPTKLLEYPSEKYVERWAPSVARCPFNTSSFGIGSKGGFDLPSQPQHRVYQRPGESTTTAASLRSSPLSYSVAGRAFEELEDPYYVTMYYPGSVYVGWDLKIFLTVGVGAQMRGWSKRIAEGLKTLLLISRVTGTLESDVTTSVSRLVQSE